MSKYSYDALREAAKQRRRIGGFKGYDVYSCSKYDYDATKKDFYVLYDDDSLLVRAGNVYGTIDDKGSVNEFNTKYWYNVPKKKGDVVTKVTPATNGYSDMVITEDFFRKIDQDINALLANASNIEFDVGEIKI